MKTTIFSIFLLMVSMSLQAQTSLNTSSGNLTSTSGIVNYSVGQAFQDVKSNTAISISEGIQQPYEIIETLGIDISEISLNVTIFPNPTQDILNLKIDFADFGKYSYAFFDASNKVIRNQKISAKNTALSIASYPSGVYYLHVTKNGKPVKTFKVLKTDK